MTNSIPAPIASRIDAGVDAIRESGVAAGLSVGDRAPDFTLPDALGHSVTLSDLLAVGPVVVVFYRGEWCPFCNLQLRSLQNELPSIREAGATLVAISPQAADHSLSLTEKHELGYPALSDLDQSVIRDYKVQFQLSGDLEDLQVNLFHNDPALQNADGSRFLPVPSTFVIDREGTIQYAFVSADWRIRPESADIVNVLKELSPPS